MVACVAFQSGVTTTIIWRASFQACGAGAVDFGTLVHPVNIAETTRPAASRIDLFIAAAYPPRRSLWHPDFFDVRKIAMNSMAEWDGDVKAARELQRELA